MSNVQWLMYKPLYNLCQFIHVNGRLKITDQNKSSMDMATSILKYFDKELKKLINIDLCWETALLQARKLCVFVVIPFPP